MVLLPAWSKSPCTATGVRGGGSHYPAMALRVRYGMSGTDIRYGPTSFRSSRTRRMASRCRSGRTLPMVLRVWYAESWFKSYELSRGHGPNMIVERVAQVAPTPRLGDAALLRRVWYYAVCGSKLTGIKDRFRATIACMWYLSGAPFCTRTGIPL
eukprot:385071-Rhodomonas_salina.1